VIDTNKNFIFNMEELKLAQFPLDELFSLQVNHNNVKYEFLVRFSSINKNLICFGSGSYDPKRENISPPIYRRHSWQKEFEESVIYYNDPTLYNDPNLTLGWGVGKNEEWYLPVIADIIRILAKKNGIEHENILFFGSSGGGFTAIILSTFIKNSTVMVNNPQILLTKWKGLFNTMIEKCFENMDLETILKEYGCRFDVIELFKCEKYMPKITYIVNIDSKDDILNHFTHFINSLASFEYFDEQVNILIYQDERGHDGIYDTQKTIKMIKNHFNVNYPPIMKSIELINNELNVSTNKVIKIIFDKPVKAGNNWIELKNSSGEVIPVKTNVKNNVLIITPGKLLKEGLYGIVLHTGCITDWVNNPIELVTRNFTV
jgi:hypothetical protein